MNFFKKKINKIPFGKPIIDHKEINSVIKVLKSGIYAHGPMSNEFEKNFVNSPDQNMQQRFHPVQPVCIYFTSL